MSSMSRNERSRLHGTKRFGNSSKSLPAGGGEHDGENSKSSPNITEESTRGKESDVRISKLARTMARLESQEVFCKACDQIEDLLHVYDHRKYVLKSFSCLVVPFGEIFKGFPGLPWVKAGTIRYGKFLSKIAELMDTSRSDRLFQWLIDFIDRKSHGSRVSETSFAVQDVILEMIPFLNQRSTSSLVSQILEVIETSNHTDIFKIMCSLYVAAVLHNPTTKMIQFTDFVDVVIGWLMEEDDDVLYGFCTEILQNLRHYFCKDSNFAMTLLTQLVEDAEVVTKDLQTNPAPKEHQAQIARITTITRVFKTILSIDCIEDKKFLCDSSEALILNVLTVLEQPIPSNENAFMFLIRHTNDCIFYCHGVDGSNIRQFFKNQLAGFMVDDGWKLWPKAFIYDLLHSITVWIDTVVAVAATQSSSTEELVAMCYSVMDFIDAIHSSASPDDKFVIVKVIHALLRTRNVSMLQKVYSWIVGKLKFGETEEKATNQPSDHIFFVLACLSDIVINKGNAILVLWTLNPPIFDLLMLLLKDSTDFRLRDCVRDMLKSHCVSHSHFVSSIVSVNSYSSESPGTKFLPALMAFWIQQISDLVYPQFKWTYEWVIEFIKSSASYASVLTQRQPEFYRSIISIICSKTSFLETTSGLLEWMCLDQHYNQSNIILDSIQDNCVTLLANPNTSYQVKWKYKNILTTLPNLVVYERSFDEDFINTQYLASAEENCSPLTSNQFNSFLSHLFTVTQTIKQSDHCQIDPSTSVEAAVEYLLRAKLKTPLGKPQEFFGQLQVMLKKHKTLKLSQDHPLPLWKLRFVYELERKLIHWIQGSSMLEAKVPEQIRAFFLTNRTPCTEWLKRMRPEVIDASLAVNDNYTAYLYATLSGDNFKVKSALLNMRDAEALKGMNDWAAYYYLQGNFEQAALATALDDSETPNGKDPFKEIIQKRTETILNSACQSLEYWSDSEPERPENCTEFLLSPSYKFPSSILDLQLNSVEKSSICVLNSTETHLSLLTLLKIGEWMKRAVLLSSTERDRFEILKARSLLEHNNLNCTKAWLKKRNIDLSLVDELRPILTFAHLSRDYLELIADVFYAESNFYVSALMYSTISDIIPPTDCRNDLEKIANFYKKFAMKIDESEEFCEGVMGRPPMLFSAHAHASFVEPLFEKSVEYSPNNKNNWFDFANYMYQLALDEEVDCEEPETTNRLKMTAVECYTNVLRLNKMASLSCGDEQEQKPTKCKIYKSITRLLRLYAQGYEFIPQEVITSEEWLDFLPELVFYEGLRPYLAKRFPHQCSLYLAPYDCRRGPSKKTCKRRGVFDSSSYTFTEINDEPINVSMPTRLPCCKPACDSSVMAAAANTTNEKVGKEGTIYVGREALHISDGIQLFLRELNRIGTCREEFWSWSLQKVVFDWTKRLSSLKKDLSKDFNLEKLKAYLCPMLTYLQSLWEETKICDTPAEIAFFNRNNEVFTTVLTQLQECETVDGAAAAFNNFLTHIESFDSIYISKLALSSLSPNLFQYNFSDSAPISLPGMPTGVYIVSVAPVVMSLATKTKPKKLMFRTSDGQSREYLVKGNENLNVDAGVMQLLKLTGEFLKCPTRTYSITPLGKRGGLIQIVEGAMPLFVLYKKYLQRKNCVERTSEMFWRRLNSMGCTDRSNPALLKIVYETLVKETPANLISSELLLCAKTPESWHLAVRSFTKDCAFGSAFGYLLGLGDRHLDNILVNLHLGHLVHVDFSIIFGKGTTLRIPEKVPFRLTQNISGALQYPGVTGPYSVYLEDFLLGFQKHQEIAMFSLNSIAVSYYLDEDATVDAESILSAELKSAILFLNLRLKATEDIIEFTKKEILDSSAEYRLSTKEIEANQEEITLCANKLEGLTVALSVLKEKQTDLIDLRALRARCELIKVKEELVKGATRLKEKLVRVENDYEDCLPLLPKIELFDFNAISLIVNSALEENFIGTEESQVDIAKLYLEDFMNGSAEAKDQAKLIAQLGWLSKRYPFSTHLFSRILNSSAVALTDANQNDLNFRLEPVHEGHTLQSALSTWTVLMKELDKSTGEVKSLRTLIISQGITDLSQEIQLWESRSSNIEETLNRFTSNYSENDFQLLLKFSLPILEQALDSEKINYDFVARLLLLARNSVTFQVPSSIADILELLLELHIDGRKLLAEFVTGDYSNFLRSGYRVVASVAEVLNSLNIDQQVVFECYSGPELMILWNKTVEELRKNVDLYDRYLQGDNGAWEGSADLVTFILAPITNFTLPLTTSCQAAIVTTARTILATNSRLLGSTPYSADPLYRLLSDFQKAHQRLRFLKDLNDGMKGCEATNTWLKGEKDRFEWAHMTLLPNNEAIIKKRTSVLKQVKSGIRSLISRVSKTNEWSLYFDSVAGNTFENFRNFAKLLLKVSQGLYVFENLRFNPAVRQDFQELVDKNPFPLDGVVEAMETEAERVLSLCGENSGLKRSQITEDDVTWANSMEKIISSQLQKHVHMKITLSEEISRLGRVQSTALGKFTKKLNRWRRILANIAPVIQFVDNYAHSAEGTEYDVVQLKELVKTDWMQNVHFWSHTKVEHLVTQWEQFEEKFESSHGVLSTLFHIIPLLAAEQEKGRISVDSSSFRDHSVEVIDYTKVESIIKTVRDKITGFNSNTTVERLISEASRVDSLAQMYEGWTPWV